ncbi:MAG: GlmL-related ornithine degradation protein [Defluviitaleaceae bacterium]|nr:GlmL-related ornithine degradation protein [Defluviitaleaceae bacterium]
MPSSITVDVLIAEIGSTTTTVNAFSGLNSDKPRLVGQGYALTTAFKGDVLPGLKDAIKDLEESLDAKLTYGQILAASSAAGGLRMTVHGLVPDMTAKAAKEAALGAGAVIRQITCGAMNQSDLAELKGINPNIILIAGGVDYGERTTAVKNALLIRELGLIAPVIYAGNITCRDEIRDIFEGSPNKLYIVDNVYPRIDELCIESARQVIQDVFEEHIVSAPGMSKVREMVKGSVMPTPGAVMEAALLLHEEIGDLLVLDIGGATTDVHAVTAGSPEIARISITPEPFAKRTVEGDLGVFLNAENLAEIAVWDVLNKELGFDSRLILKKYSGVPSNDNEIALITRLAEIAGITSIKRHAGKTKHLYGPAGRISIAEGKDLSCVRHIIGTGGVLTRLKHGWKILEKSMGINNITGEFLLPKATDLSYHIDKNYIMAALGVLSKVDREAAVLLLRQMVRSGESNLECPKP